MADITIPFLLSFTDAINGTFNQRLTAAPTQYGRIAWEVQSMTRENVYPRLDDIPGMREWIGDRVVLGLSGGAFAIVNRKFETTLEIKRDDFEDDQYGLYTPIVQQWGQSAAELPDILTFGLLTAGDATNCYDGTPFFGAGHRTYNAAGVQQAYSNLQSNVGAPDAAGAPGPAWYLFDTRRPLKPMIVQRRRPFVLTPRISLNDPSVFDRGSFLWGVDGRMNVGYGMFQLAYKSYAPLTSANFAAARAAMASQHRIDGVPFGIKPDVLMFPPALAAQARTLLLSETINATSNPWKGAADPVEVEWLS